MGSSIEHALKPLASRGRRAATLTAGGAGRRRFQALAGGASCNHRNTA